LELLADFVANVGIVGMKFGEFVFVDVDVSEDELFFVEGCDDLQDVEGPATFFDFEVFERA
jgi:hypothetical protein